MHASPRRRRFLPAAPDSLYGGARSFPVPFFLFFLFDGAFSGALWVSHPCRAHAFLGAVALCCGLALSVLGVPCPGHRRRR